MRWFRTNRNGARRAVTHPSARPTLEVLEDRNLLNASVAFDAGGNIAEVVVFNNGNAFLFTSAGNSQIGMTGTATSVRVAHVFRDAAGRIGLDVVYSNGQAVESTSTGSRVIGSFNVLDLSTAFDSKGNVQTDVVFNNGAGGGNLFEFTNSGSALLATNAIFASAYVDVNGNLGRAVGLFLSNTGRDQSFTQDSTGTKILYFGSAGGDPVTDYDQSSPASTASQAAVIAQTLVTITQGFGGCFLVGPGASVQAIGNDNIGTA
jgi:hypothetical protein